MKRVQVAMEFTRTQQLVGVLVLLCGVLASFQLVASLREVMQGKMRELDSLGVARRQQTRTHTQMQKSTGNASSALQETDEVQVLDRFICCCKVVEGPCTPEDAEGLKVAGAESHLTTVRTIMKTFCCIPRKFDKEVFDDKWKLAQKVRNLQTSYEPSCKDMNGQNGEHVGVSIRLLKKKAITDLWEAAMVHGRYSGWDTHGMNEARMKDEEKKNWDEFAEKFKAAKNAKGDDSQQSALGSEIDGLVRLNTELVNVLQKRGWQDESQREGNWQFAAWFGGLQKKEFKNLLKELEDAHALQPFLGLLDKFEIDSKKHDDLQSVKELINNKCQGTIPKHDPCKPGGSMIYERDERDPYSQFTTRCACYHGWALSISLSSCLRDRATTSNEEDHSL